jgi:hypothetical protein
MKPAKSTKPTPDAPKSEIIMGPMTPAELNRYRALKEELASQLDIINTAFIKAGRILRQIRDERLYRGEFDTFEQFCRLMVGKDKRYVNRIIQAHGVVEELMLQGVRESELPNNERICREQANYPMPDIKKIYSRAKQLALAKGKATPDSITIREAAATVVGSPEARRRQPPSPRYPSLIKNKNPSRRKTFVSKMDEENTGNPEEDHTGLVDPKSPCSNL